MDPSPERLRVGRRLAPALLLIGEAGGFAGLVILLFTGRLMDALWVLQFMVAAGMLLAVLWTGARRRRVWSEPLAKLEQLLPEVREGREPIESLGRVGGNMGRIAGLCQEMLRELRSEQLRCSRLQEEIRQRIATRTVALERTIGALRQQAARDGLTGLFNRRMLDAYLPEVIERCKGGGAPLCLLMIDVDHFKPLNDTLGHAAGDQMLKSIGQIIRSTIRENDAAFRCGGDEFVVVLEGCGAEPGRAVADRIASLSDALGKTFRVINPPRLSIGVANLAEVREPTAEAVLRRADQALYQVKTEHHRAVEAARTRQSA